MLGNRSHRFGSVAAATIAFVQIRARHVVLSAIAAAIVLAWFFWQSPDRAIRDLLQDGARAVQEKDLARAMSHVSRQYLDDNGLNYLGVRRVLTLAFERYAHLEVHLAIVSIDVQGDRAHARARLSIVAAGPGSGERVRGAHGTPDLVTIALVKEVLAWKVTSVDGVDVSRLGL
jgi:ketosteroid isomerase-like protein